MSTIFGTEKLTRRFGDKLALDNLNFELNSNCVTGLIGRNGSGKTTLIRILVGLLLPTTGTARTFGTPVQELGKHEFSRIGAVFQENRLLGWMTVEGQLDFARHLHGRWDLDRQSKLLEALELNPKDRVGTLSPGNAQKLALLLAVCSHPELLILDEPVSALDPIAREELLTFLMDLVREEETTILISSHVLVDIERVVDRIACLDRGRIIHESTLDDLLEGYAEWIVTAPADDLSATFGEGFREDWIVEQKLRDRQAQLLVRTGQNAEERRTRFEESNRVSVLERPANLERIFPSLVGASPLQARQAEKLAC